MLSAADVRGPTQGRVESACRSSYACWPTRTANPKQRREPFTPAEFDPFRKAEETPKERVTGKVAWDVMQKVFRGACGSRTCRRRLRREGRGQRAAGRGQMEKRSRWIICEFTASDWETRPRFETDHSCGSPLANAKRESEWVSPERVSRRGNFSPRCEAGRPQEKTQEKRWLTPLLSVPDRASSSSMPTTRSSKGLEGAEGKLESWGLGIAKVGAAVFGAGALIEGALDASLVAFEEVRLRARACRSGPGSAWKRCSASLRRRPDRRRSGDARRGRPQDAKDAQRGQHRQQRGRDVAGEHRAEGAGPDQPLARRAVQKNRRQPDADSQHRAAFRRHRRWAFSARAAWPRCQCSPKVPRGSRTDGQGRGAWPDDQPRRRHGGRRAARVDEQRLGHDPRLDVASRSCSAAPRDGPV